MQTRVKNIKDITIISISGSLDIEIAQPFKKACLDHLPSKKVVFNMKDASFVGSTGIQPFIETVQALSNQSDFGLKLVGIKSEFKRIFQNMEIAKIEFHDSDEKALESFVKPVAADSIPEVQIEAVQTVIQVSEIKT